MSNRRLVRWGAVVVGIAGGFAPGAWSCPVVEPEPICDGLEALAAPWTNPLDILPAFDRATAALERGEGTLAFELMRSLVHVRFEDDSISKAERVLLTTWRRRLPDDPRLAVISAQRRNETARDALAAVRTRHPDFALAAEALAGELRSQGDELGGRRLLEGFVVAHPQDADGLHALLEYEWRSERTARAAELAETWRSQQPGDFRARFHQLVTRLAVGPDPQLESRLAEMARSEQAPEHLLAACSALSGARGRACTTGASTLIDLRAAKPGVRAQWIRGLLRYDALDEALQLFALQDDASERRELERDLAWALARAARCEEATALVEAIARGDDDFLNQIVIECLSPAQRRERWLATLDARRAGESVPLHLLLLDTPDDPELEAALRSRLRAAPQDGALWSALAGALPAGSERQRQVWRDWARARPADPTPVSLLAGAAEAAEAWQEADALLARLGDIATGYDREEAFRRRVHALAASGNREGLARLAAEVAPGAEEATVLAQATLDRLDGRLDDALAAVRRLDADQRGWQADQLAAELELARLSDEEIVASAEAGGSDLEGKSPLEVAFEAWSGGRAEPARKLLSRATADDPGDPQLWHLIGLFEREHGQAAVAERALRRALSLRPDDSATREVLSELLREDQQWWEAFDVLAEFEIPDDSVVGALVELARAARLEREFHVADRAVRLARELAPRAVDARFEAAALAAAEEREDLARDEAAQLVRVADETAAPRCASDCDAKELLRRARAYLRSGDAALLRGGP